MVYAPAVKQQEKKVRYEMPEEICQVRDKLKFSFNEYLEVYNEYENLRADYRSTPTIIRTVAHSAVQDLAKFVDEFRTVCESPDLLDGLKKYFPKYLTSVHLSLILQFSELRCLHRRYINDERKCQICDEIVNLQENMYELLDNYGANML